MPINDHFLKRLRKHFDPYTSTSGTEHVAYLLYSLAKMTRPRSLVEFGPGYTTLFLLRAMADNIEHVECERRDLLKKTEESRILEAIDASREISSIAWTPTEKAAYRDWLFAAGQACAVDPAYYNSAYKTQLYSFELLDLSHDYPAKVATAIEQMGLSSLFNQMCGGTFSKARLPADAFPIGLAWNDCDNYREFFTEFWESLDPAGGLMIFHNVTAWSLYFEDIEWMKQSRASCGDLEILILEEGHKLNQNSCAVLRRSAVRPRFSAENAKKVIGDLRQTAGVLAPASVGSREVKG